MSSQNYKKTILIDLDGVLNQYNGNFMVDFIPPIQNGGRNFIIKLSEKYDIRLFTTRNKLLASKWLIQNELENYINDITNVKELCWLIIDDRCLKFDGNYKKLLEDIESFKPWYK